MIKIGMIIGDRYEILEKIGTGGMSDVYKARCHKLNRLVAIKVLKQEFSENESFVERFSTEAQAAACLIHPNIVTVYDVGEENGMYYIVMELVDGITLKKYIEKKARLSVKEAVTIAIQIAMGIEAAHNKHIIHRDIKPQNIIISKEGKVKVADFGIAKAATSNTITSNVMGSVHYTSPEQARGGYSDEKSDVYSMGITLFEMLTGRVPFTGDTTVAIAIKHIQEEMPSPREFVPEIPVSVEQIVFKCCQKSPSRRYQSMGELIEDLKQSLLNPDEDFVKVVDPDKQASTRMITNQDMEKIKKVSGNSSRIDETIPAPPEHKRGRKKDAFAAEETDLYDDEYDDDSDFDPKKERLTTILTIGMAVLVGVIAILVAGNAFGIFHFGTAAESSTSATESSQVKMIDVSGMSLTEAQEKLQAIGLKTEVEYVDSSAYDADTVISSDVEAGTMVDTNTAITLTVSAGKEGVTVPDVTGKDYETARKELEKAGFAVNKTETTSSTVTANAVISQTPKGNEKAAKGSNVALTVSTGSEDSKARVPSLIGLSEDEAMAKLTEAGLTLGTVTQVGNADIPADQVCYQSVSEGSYVNKDSAVDVRISTGSKQATYTYSGNITGPTAAEDPAYRDGTNVAVTIVTADGTQLLNTTTSSFPISVNYSGIKSATGTITFTYVDTTDPVTTTDPNTGAATVTQGTSTDKTVTRAITFTES